MYRIYALYEKLPNKDYLYKIDHFYFRILHAEACIRNMLDCYGVSYTQQAYLTDYGCWCGVGGSGTPQNDFDRYCVSSSMLLQGTFVKHRSLHYGKSGELYSSKHKLNL